MNAPTYSAPPRPAALRVKAIGPDRRRAGRESSPPALSAINPREVDALAVDHRPAVDELVKPSMSRLPRGSALEKPTELAKALAVD